jgi:choline dehydrogenase-like flavoprotein
VFIDTNELDRAITADVAIVGTGACGLAMAKSFLEKGLSVAMLETGGLERSAEGESLTKADLRGTLPVWIRSRSRFLGGSTNSWGGNNSPLDPVDFDRDWVPQAQWPIGLAELQPYVAEVHDLFHLGPADFTVEFWKERLPRLKDRVLFEGSDRVGTKIIQRTHVGHLGQSLERMIDAAHLLSVYLHAHVTRIDMDVNEENVAGLEVTSLDGTRKVAVHADHYVLAGGPENSRLLLASRHENPAGVGNAHDQVGKWWIGHHSSLRGWIEPAADLDWSFYDSSDHPVGEIRVYGALHINEATQRRERMLNSAAILENFNPMKAFNNRARTIAALKGAMGRSSESLEVQQIDADLATGALRDVSTATKLALSEVARTRSGKPARIGVRNWCEQIPHPDNRVELSDELDSFGTPKMRIVSNLYPEDRDNLRKAFDLLGDEFEKFGYGKWISDFPEGDAWPAGTINTSHFMGGTRMSSSPNDGVVNEYGRVHGMDNLWIAGGSVFPTAGVSMVTYTAVLLALRTAQRIAATTVPSENPGGTSERREIDLSQLPAVVVGGTPNAPLPV